MTKRIAALTCCLSLLQVCVVTAEETHPALITSAAAGRAPQAGPIRTALLSVTTQTMVRAETRAAARPVRDSGRPRGNWMERHPVWAGALVGFGTGVVLTYAMTRSDHDEFITVMSPGAGAVIWGSVSAGVGALAGWGIGRNRDDDDGSK
jgi:hypothetical protein